MWNNHQVNNNYGQAERNRTIAKEKENTRNFRLGLLMVILPFLTFFILALTVPKKARAADASVNINQVGSNNVINIEQYNAAHNATITLGTISPVDNTNISIVQRDSGVKTASVEIPSGINNGVTILQQGTGNHTASIQNLNGSGNSISVDQNGAGNHEFNVVAGTGTINNGNTINATQTGGAGADKWFQVNLSGATGATVNVQQTNPTQAQQGSMNIQCSSGCGTWSYIRN
jgi:hypothetical protein